VSRYPYSCVVQVRYADVDAMDHVNNAVHVTYLEVARTGLWRDRIGNSGSARDFPFIVARIAVDYRAPIRLDDVVCVEVGVVKVGRSSFTLAYRITASGRLATEAESVQVLYDYAAGTSRPIDPELRARLEALRVSPGP
jgi:acyl-CoA thioester hydrolase